MKPHKHPAGTSDGLTAAHDRQLGLVTQWSVPSVNLWHMDVHVERSPQAHSNAAQTALFTTTQCTCNYENYIFIGQ